MIVPRNFRSIKANSMFGRIVSAICILCVLAVLSGCSQPSSAPKGSAPASSSSSQAGDTCAYVQTVGSTLSQAQQILKGAQIGNAADLNKRAADMDSLLRSFGRTAMPADANDLGTWTAGTLAGYAAILRAMATNNEADMNANFTITQSLMTSMTDEIASLKSKHGCN